MSEAEESRPLAAAGLMVAAMAIVGFIDLYVAVIAETMSLWQFQAVRTAMSLALVAALARAGFGTMRPRRLWAVMVRSALTATGLLCYFGALAFMPLAQALAGLFTSPIWVLVVTSLWLRRPVGPWRVAAVALGFGGVLLVLGPGAGEGPGWVLLLPVAGGLFYGLGAVATRALCAGESTLAMLTGAMGLQGLVGALAVAALTVWGGEAAPGAAGFLTRGWVWEMGPAMPWLVLQAVGSVLGVLLLIRAYQSGEASQVSVFEFSALVFGPLFGWLIFGQALGPAQLGGIALIGLAGLIIALRSREGVPRPPRP